VQSQRQEKKKQLKREKMQNVTEPKKLTVLKDPQSGKLFIRKKGFECQHVDKGKCLKCFFSFRSLINIT
jgi:hypothetical protein